jgi:aldose 1-epimerase
MRFATNINRQYSSPSIELIDTFSQTKVEIFCFGGLLNSFSIQQKNTSFNVVDGYKNVDDCVAQKNTWFKSCKLSPFVCRLKNGEYEFQNQIYKIEKFYLGNHAMHGAVYDAVYAVKSLEANDSNACAILQYQYAGTDNGFPFAYSIKLIWKLEANNKLSVTSVIEHQNEFSIPYCEGWHPYFKLDEPIDDCNLQFDGNEMLEFDETLIPTGKLVNDDRFLNSTLLKNIELDNCYLLSKISQPKCVLKSKQLSLSIMPSESYPYLQVFIPDHKKNIAIENLSAAPDAFNNKIGLLMLKPNSEYSFTTSYQIDVLQNSNGSNLLPLLLT